MRIYSIILLSESLEAMDCNLYEHRTVAVQLEDDIFIRIIPRPSGAVLST